MKKYTLQESLSNAR